MGGPRIIENTMISIYSHGLFGGVGSAGGPNIDENTLISMHVHGLFNAVGGAGGPRFETILFNGVESLEIC